MSDTCRQGHPWTPENTHNRPDGRRECRTCKAAYQRARDAAAREARAKESGARRYGAAAAIAEDCEWLLDAGCGWGEILTRLGYRHRSSLEKQLRRAGRDDLAAQLLALGTPNRAEVAA